MYIFRRPFYSSPKALTPLLDDDGRIADDVACIRCGYNLRTLKAEAKCSECGQTIARMLGSVKFIHCDARWVSRLANGIGWLMASLTFVVIAWGVPVWLNGFLPPVVSDDDAAIAGWVDGLRRLIASLLLLRVTWGLTASEPVARPFRIHRRDAGLLRLAGVGLVALAVFNLPLESVANKQAVDFAGLLALAILLSLFAGLDHLSERAELPPLPGVSLLRRVGFVIVMILLGAVGLMALLAVVLLTAGRRWFTDIDAVGAALLTPFPYVALALSSFLLLLVAALSILLLLLIVTATIDLFRLYRRLRVIAMLTSTP